MPPQYQPQQLYDIPQYMDPELAHHGPYPTTVTPGQQPEKKSVMIDVNAFVRTRDALASAYIGLSQAIDRSVKAYVEHTSVVLASDASLNVSYLTQPFDQLAHTAQLAQQALISNGVAGGSEAKQETPEGDKKGKRKKRAYKQRDPNAPKRPLTAYFRYLQEQRGPLGKELAEKAGGQPQRPGDLSKVATQRWNALDEEGHRPYKEAYQRALKDYEKEVERYKAAGGKVDESALAGVAEDEVAEGAEDEDEDAEGEEVVDAKAVAAAADEEDEDDDSSSEESSDEEEEENEPTPPPPPPPAPKTPKSALKKSKKEAAAVAPTPQFSSINTSSEAAKPSSSPERKRKAAATPSSAAAEEPATKKKRGRKPNAEKVTAGEDAVIPSTAPPAPAPVAPMSSAEAMPPPPSSEPSKKKKKRKSEA